MAEGVVDVKDGMKLHEAMMMAVKAHKGQVRKGTDVPYIVHPMEVLQILTAMRGDTELLVAGVLHDVVEDTTVTAEDIQERFGNEVAELVCHHTEDKRQSWEERKQATINEIRKGNQRVRYLIFADMLSNLRSQWADYQEVGEALWKRFNAPKEKQSWYYSARLDAFDDMMGDECAENFYWEAQALYKDIYVAFYMDTEDGMLYQESAHGEKYCLPFNTVQWQEYDGEIPKSCVRIVRTLAERLEDNGSASFWMCHTCDCDDARYMLREDGSFIHTVVVEDGNVFFLIEGENQDGAIYGYWFDDMNTKRFFVQLRIVYGIESCLSNVLKTAFGGADGISRLLAFCNKHQVVYKRLIYSQNNGDECNLIQ